LAGQLEICMTVEQNLLPAASAASVAQPFDFAEWFV
jgi:hypothetical protein